MESVCLMAKAAGQVNSARQAVWLKIGAGTHHLNLSFVVSRLMERRCLARNWRTFFSARQIRKKGFPEKKKGAPFRRPFRGGPSSSQSQKLPRKSRPLTRTGREGEQSFRTQK